MLSVTGRCRFGGGDGDSFPASARHTEQSSPHFRKVSTKVNLAARRRLPYSGSRFLADTASLAIFRYPEPSFLVELAVGSGLRTWSI